MTEMRIGRADFSPAARNDKTIVRHPSLREGSYSLAVCSSGAGAVACVSSLAAMMAGVLVVPSPFQRIAERAVRNTEYAEFEKKLQRVFDLIDQGQIADARTAFNELQAYQAQLPDAAQRAHDHLADHLFNKTVSLHDTLGVEHPNFVAAYEFVMTLEGGSQVAVIVPPTEIVWQELVLNRLLNHKGNENSAAIRETHRKLTAAYLGQMQRFADQFDVAVHNAKNIAPSTHGYMYCGSRAAVHGWMSGTHQPQALSGISDMVALAHPVLAQFFANEANRIETPLSLASYEYWLQGLKMMMTAYKNSVWSDYVNQLQFWSDKHVESLKRLNPMSNGGVGKHFAHFHWSSFDLDLALRQLRPLLGIGSVDAAWLETFRSQDLTPIYDMLQTAQTAYAQWSKGMTDLTTVNGAHSRVLPALMVGDHASFVDLVEQRLAMGSPIALAEAAYIMWAQLNREPVSDGPISYELVERVLLGEGDSKLYRELVHGDARLIATIQRWRNQHPATMLRQLEADFAALRGK